MKFKWIKNGARIPGATANTYTIGSVVESDKAIYWVVVDNGAGKANSKVVSLGVDEPPKIIEEPKEQSINPGESIELEVLAVGKKPFDYQWFKDGKLLRSQTQQRLSIYKADVNDEGTYHVTIANTAGTATSKKAEVVIYRLPVFDVQPMDLSLNPNTTAIFSARIHGLNIKNRKTVDNNFCLFAGRSACSIGDGYVIGSLIVYIGFVYA
jgi:hypothetical protein